MAEQNRGSEPAFPRINSNQEWVGGIPGAPGMTLREYYAGQAMAGLLSSRPELSNVFDIDGAEVVNVARLACMIADTLLVELNEV